jgi:hypothetical protein
MALALPTLALALIASCSDASSHEVLSASDLPSGWHMQEVSASSLVGAARTLVGGMIAPPFPCQRSDVTLFTFSGRPVVFNQSVHPIPYLQIISYAWACGSVNTAKRVFKKI